MPPAFVLALVVVLLSASVFHTAVGRTWRGLALAFVASLAGFVAGEAVARAIGHDVLMVGPVHMTHGLIGSWLAMVIARVRGA